MRPSRCDLSSSKAAVEMLVSALALEEADNGVKVLAVRPGLVQTAMVDTLEASLNALGPSQRQFLAETRRAEPYMAAERIVALLLGETNSPTGSTVDLTYE